MSESDSEKSGRTRRMVPDPTRGLRVMGRLVKRALKPAGTPPGSLVHGGPRKTEQVTVSFMDYDEDQLREGRPESVEEIFELRDTPTVSWIDVTGLHDERIMETLRDHLGFHVLMMEDVVHVGQRPKFEEYDPHLFVVLSMLELDEETAHLQSEQLSIILGPNFVFTFQERPGDVFEPVRERIRSGRPRLRKGGPDFLAYALMDAVVDSYFHVLESIGDRIEVLEEEVLEDPGHQTMKRIHHLKREMLVMRKAVWPLRDALGSLYRDESPLVSDQTRVFLRDVHDHAVQVIDTVETLRDVLSGIMDLYLSAVGQRTNEVMKVLTIMASIFIPLTFMAGIYGMNFEYMPELSRPWAYPTLLGVMLALGVGMVWFFRRKDWI